VLQICIRRLFWCVLVLLSGCFGASPSAPNTAPAGFTATAGDGVIQLTWNSTGDASTKYYLYYKAGATVAVRELDATPVIGITSPALIRAVNGTQYAFVINATQNGSAAGPSSPVVTATPRAVGDASSTWTALPALGTGALNSVAFNGTYLCTVGDAGAIYRAAYNYEIAGGAPTWAAPTTLPSPAVTSNLVSVISDGARFLALGSDGTVLYSSDTSGLSWSKAAPTYPISLAGVTLHSLAYGGGVYVAVGSGGNVFYTSSLATATPVWTLASPATANELFQVRYLNGGFFAVGANGAIVSSADAVTWHLQTSPTANTLRAVAFGGVPGAAYYFLAVGDNGTIVSLSDNSVANLSAQANTWTLQVGNASLALGNLYDVIHGPTTQFIAAGINGLEVYSPTGTDGTWVKGAAGSATLYSLAPTTEAVYGVGAAGANVIGR